MMESTSIATRRAYQAAFLLAAIRRDPDREIGLCADHGELVCKIPGFRRDMDAEVMAQVLEFKLELAIVLAVERDEAARPRPRPRPRPRNDP